MSRQAELVLKAIFVGVLAAAVALSVAAIAGGVDTQMEALPYYAQLWGR